MGQAIMSAIDLLRDRKAEYKANGISHYRPWIFLITDGGPTDGNLWKTAAEEIKRGEQSKSFAFFAVGVEGANFEVLNQLSNRQALRLKGLRFRDLFQWLSHSQQSVSRSSPGDAVPLENPTGPEGWASI
ncbi:hypothetical protein VT03_17215 [Planctomyces sp. SH-PL14]|nr:hypothetical protein VT03_17215 [Planctomyces sp. SH-PL14]